MNFRTLAKACAALVRTRSVNPPSPAPRRTSRTSQSPGVEALEPRQLLAADPLVFDPNDTAWYSYYDLTSAQYSQVFQQRRGESLPVDIDLVDDGQQVRIGTTWIKNTDNRDWAAWRDLSSEGFGQKWQEYKDQGYRLVDQEAYTQGGQQYYAGIWVENRESYGWLSYRNMSAAELQTLYDQYSETHLPIDIDAYQQLDGSTRYSAIFVQNASDLEWQSRYGLTSAEFASLFDSLRGTHRVTDIESYQDNGQQRYAVVWVRNSNGRAWASRRDLTEVQFWNEFNSYLDEGYRIVDSERYRVGNEWRYAAVWRQNGERLNWSLKSKVDQLITKQLNDFKVPGMSVVVVKDGNYVYRRGFGYQDVNDGLKYSSSTINRLASVSKAVAGVLSLDLVEKKLLDINRKSSSYIGKVNGKGLPKHHTHTLRQLLSNRGGIGHYDELGEPTGSYSTALAASAKFWSKPLVGKPGVKYHYSTHAYTLLGAAIEGALRKPISQVVRQYLTDAYALGTLGVENRSAANRYRSAVYDTANKEITPDNTSWKVLGGGLEASAYDLARFAELVRTGKILTRSSLNDMWTAPPPKSVPYGLGWDLATINGVKRVEKNGGQIGANTHLLMYPDRGIVVAVLSNRYKGGHDARTLARAIGNLVLKSG